MKRFLKLQMSRYKHKLPLLLLSYLIRISIFFPLLSYSPYPYPFMRRFSFIRRLLKTFFFLSFFLPSLIISLTSGLVHTLFILNHYFSQYTFFLPFFFFLLISVMSGLVYTFLLLSRCFLKSTFFLSFSFFHKITLT